MPDNETLHRFEDAANQLASAHTRLADVLESFLEEIKQWRYLTFPPLKPKRMVITLISERVDVGMSDILLYEAKFPVMGPEHGDVETQQFDVFTVDAEGNRTPVDSQIFDRDVEVAQFEVPQDSTVEVELVYFDDAGNASPVRTQRFDALDTIPPDAPGDFREIVLIGEREEEEPSVEPTTEPESESENA